MTPTRDRPIAPLIDPAVTPHLGMTLLEIYAGQCFVARIQAAWSSPGPTKAAYAEYKAGLPPDIEPMGFRDWLAEQSLAYAYSLCDAIDRVQEDPVTSV